jgi:hypothetical protein
MSWTGEAMQQNLEVEGAVASRRARLVAGRQRNVMLYCGGLVLWFGAMLLRRYAVPHFAASRAVDLGLKVTSVVGGVICVWALVGIVRLALLLRKDPALRATLHDERMRGVKLRVAAAGFIAVIVTQMVMLFAIAAWPSLKELPASVPVEVTVVVGIAAIAGGILVFGRD